MKTTIVSLVIGLLMIHTLTGQVKIGDNPQNLDPASVLELESTSKALVIPRLTDAQMNAITPLRGALVYNTDQDCIHYFDGSQWINICEALDNSFTVSTRADFLSQINPNARDSTVVITPTLNPDGSTNYNFEVNQITGANIAPSAINGDKIQNGTVGSLDLAEGAVTLPKLADAENGVPGDIIQWDGFNWVLVNENILGITEVDGIVGNEVVGPTDGTLDLNGGGSGTDPYTLDVADGGITNNELADNSVNSDKIQDGQVATVDLANNAVTNVKMADNSVGTAELIDDSVDADKINANVAGTGLQQAGDGSLEVNVTQFTGDGTLSSPDGTMLITGTPLTALFENVGIDLIDNAVTTAKILDGEVNTNDLADNAVTTTKIGTAGVADADKVLTTDVNGDPIWEDRTNFASSTLNDGQMFVGDATNTATGVTMGGDATITNAGVLTISNDAVTTNKIAPGAVETTDIATDAVSATKINPDVAGNGLVQDGAGALQVNVDDATIEISANVLQVKPSATNGQVLATEGGSVVWRSPYLAIGKMNANSQIRSNGVSIVNNLGTGNYQVVFSSAAATSDYVVQLTLFSAGPDTTIEVTAQTANNFTVQITDNNSGLPVDAQWYFTVIDF
ncbi:MAG: hypothetical protein KDD31_02385 [Muricauda sp.]|nr:hypothetical protein [Allomuricauda sp.]